MMVDTKPTIELYFTFEEETLEEGLQAFYFNNGLTGRVTHEVLQEQGLGGGWPLIRFTCEDQDTLFELGTGYGLAWDDPALQPLAEPAAARYCEHPSTRSDDGVWTCDECEQDVTLESLDGLVDTLVEILGQAKEASVGDPLELSSRVLEASIWFNSAKRAAKVIADRSSPWRAALASPSSDFVEKSLDRDETL